MPTASILKFRCYRCNGLLGVSRSRVGKEVSCPKCGAELIVPEPTDGSVETEGTDRAPSPPPSRTSESAPASNIPSDLLDIRPEDIRVEPGIEYRVPEAEPLPSVADAPVSAESYAVDEAGEEDIEIEVQPEPVAADAPPEAEPEEPDEGVPPIRLDGPRPTRVRALAPRARDLVLPRSVVAAWSLFVLLAQALAFMAGLLAGHYVWKIH